MAFFSSLFSGIFVAELDGDGDFKGEEMLWAAESVEAGELGCGKLGFWEG